MTSSLIICTKNKTNKQKKHIEDFIQEHFTGCNWDTDRQSRGERQEQQLNNPIRTSQSGSPLERTSGKKSVAAGFQLRVLISIEETPPFCSTPGQTEMAH